MRYLFGFFCVCVLGPMTVVGCNGTTVDGEVSVLISPDSATVVINDQQQFTATVTGTGDESVTWSVDGAGCSGSGCGSVSDTGLFTAPPAVPDPPTVTVTAASQADTSESDAATVMIVDNKDHLLDGAYAFLFSGFDDDGAMAAAGSFVADGMGSLTAGIEDVTRFSGVESEVSFTGTYSIDLDNRGTLTLTSSIGTATFSLVLGAAGSGRMIELDSSGTRGSGIFKAQDPVDFSASAIHGGYAFGFSGMVPSLAPYRVARVGRFDADGSGALTNGVFDAAAPAIVAPNLSFEGSYAVPDGSVRGRGTALFEKQPIPGPAEILNLAFYIVSAEELFFVSSDVPVPALPLLSGVAKAQSGGPFDNGFLNETVVYDQTGVSTVPTSSVTVGQIVADGSWSLSGRYDQNYNGTIYDNVIFTGNYDISSNGRGLLNWKTHTTFVPAFFYVVGDNEGFLLHGPELNPIAEVASGTFEGQTGAPFDGSTFSGDYSFGTVTPATDQVVNLVGVATLDGEAGTLAGIQDSSGPDGNATDQTLAGGYEISEDGRGNMVLQSGNLRFYAISPGKAVAIDFDPGDNQTAVVKIEQ